MSIRPWAGPRWSSARASVDDSCDACHRKHHGLAVVVDGANANEYGPDVYCGHCVLDMLTALLGALRPAEK